MKHESESVLMLADRGISVVVSTNNQSLTKTSLIPDLLSEQCALAAISTPSDLVARVQAALHQASGTGRLRFTIVADRPTGIAGIVPGAASSLFVDEVVRDDIATGPLRLGVCSWRLNASGASRGVALASDPELNRGRHWAETQGFTEALWLNTDGLVAAAGVGIPTYRAPDGRFCLPTLEAGGPITYWHSQLLECGFQQLDFNIDELLAARNCVVVSWEGYMRVVTSIDGQMFRNDSELHQRLEDCLFG